MINQVKRFLCKRTLYLLQHRHYCEHPGKVLYPLINRKLIKVAGSDSAVYLQGLITNDMRHFEDGAKSMYAMFLNTKGRILYDTLILKLNDDYLLECDKPIVSALQKHLKIYKLKRQITIEDVSERYKIGALISDPNKVIEPTDDPKTQVNIYKDPRLNELGHRVLMSADVSEEKVKEIIGENTRISDSDRGYKYLRYTLGVSEGAEDISPGTSFPLEANCDYLHGVSFHKGCYIGQELTARVHHTGVVRKRMMPIKFTEEVQGLEVDTIISTKSNPKSNFGKLKGYVADYGLGIVRIKEALESKDLTIGKYTVDVQKPTWWPIEAPKEKVTAVKE